MFGPLTGVRPNHRRDIALVNAADESIVQRFDHKRSSDPLVSLLAPATEFIPIGPWCYVQMGLELAVEVGE